MAALIMRAFIPGASQAGWRGRQAREVHRVNIPADTIYHKQPNPSDPALTSGCKLFAMLRGRLMQTIARSPSEY